MIVDITYVFSLCMIYACVGALTAVRTHFRDERWLWLDLLCGAFWPLAWIAGIVGLVCLLCLCPLWDSFRLWLHKTVCKRR